MKLAEQCAQNVASYKESLQPFKNKAVSLLTEQITDECLSLSRQGFTKFEWTVTLIKHKLSGEETKLLSKASSYIGQAVMKNLLNEGFTEYTPTTTVDHGNLGSFTRYGIMWSV